MPWLAKSEAAKELGISLPALDRRLASGTLASRRQGEHVLVMLSNNPVEPDDPADDTLTQMVETTDRLAQTGTQLAQTAAAMATQNKQEANSLSQALAAMAETRETFLAETARARQQNDRAHAARPEAPRPTRRFSILISAVGLVAVLMVTWTNWTQTKTLSDVQQNIGRLERSYAQVLAKHIDEIRSLRQSAGLERDSAEQARLQVVELRAKYGQLLAVAQQSAEPTPEPIDENIVVMTTVEPVLVPEDSTDQTAESPPEVEQKPKAESLEQFINNDWTPPTPTNHRPANGSQD